MSRMSRTAKLIVAARGAARGITLQVRLAALGELHEAKLPDRDIVGFTKFATACRLKQMALGLEFLSGEERTIKADEVIELSQALMQLPDRAVTCATEPVAAERRYHWMKD